MKRFKVKIYNKYGDFSQDFHTNNFKLALKRYLKEAELCKIRPTLWVNNGKGKFVRVHDFYFDEVNDATLKVYLRERIIDADDLLSAIAEY